jgi:hypothetical protein
MVWLGGLGTILTAFLMWLFAKVMSRPQHDEIVKLIQDANERFVAELRDSHKEEAGGLRERLKVLDVKSDQLQKRNEELCDKLLEVTQENGNLKLEVAVLRKEVEMLRSSSPDVHAGKSEEQAR